MTDNHIDMSVLQELKGVMEDEFSLLINTYLSDAELRIDALKKAFKDKKAEAVCRTAHSFKGSSSNLGAVELVELLRKMEDCGREKKLDEAEGLLAEVQREYGYVKAAMTQWSSR